MVDNLPNVYSSLKVPLKTVDEITLKYFSITSSQKAIKKKKQQHPTSLLQHLNRSKIHSNPTSHMSFDTCSNTTPMVANVPM